MRLYYPRWMLPAMLPQHPGIARAMIAYRGRTMGAALANAKAQGLNGTKWAWESAFSGVTATGGSLGSWPKLFSKSKSN